VCINCGIQPDKLTAYLEQAAHALANDGMLQRFQVLVYPDLVLWEGRDRAPDKAARHVAFAVFESLADFDPLTSGAASADQVVKFPHFSFNEEAQQDFIECSEDVHRVRIPNEDEPLMRQHLTKFDKLFPAVALIFHLVDCAAHGIKGPVTQDAALRAAAWCEYLEAHARRCYGLLKDDGLRAAQALAVKLERGTLEGRLHPARRVSQSMAQPDDGPGDRGRAELTGRRKLVTQRSHGRFRPGQWASHVALPHPSGDQEQAKGGRRMNWLERARREIPKSAQPGNAGKPRGARHKTTLAIEALLDGEAEKLTRKAVEMALNGDTVALRLCLEGICPPRRDRTVAVDLPKIERAADMVMVTAALVEAATCGVTTPAEAAELGKLTNRRSCASDRDGRFGGSRC
jgi:hypothetical protein